MKAEDGSTQTLETKNIVVATGSYERVPSIPGADRPGRLHRALRAGHQLRLRLGDVRGELRPELLLLDVQVLAAIRQRHRLPAPARDGMADRLLAGGEQGGGVSGWLVPDISFSSRT